MKKFEDFIVKNRVTILILTLILMIPAFIGIQATKINYDILVYLPEDIETIKGQGILTDEFNMGAFAVSMLNDLSPNEILNLESEIKKIDGVEKVVSTYDAIGTMIPIEVLPNDLQDKIHKDATDLMLITFRDGTSSIETLNAVQKIKEIAGYNAKVSGMSSMVLDTMNLSEKEIFIYIVIAVILCILVLELSLDSYIVPFLLLINIGIAILFNLGTNIIFGEISYITKALVAVLQLGVTTDFSIFLYHAYQNAKKKEEDKKKAMSIAIHETFTSVVGSSLTTIAGFLVLITMKLTLGSDLGLVMAKGVFLGVVCVLTVFPSLLLVSDKLIDKFKHKSILPNFTKLNNFIVRHYKKVFAIFLILLIPAYLANSKVSVYYKLDESLPKDLDSIVANNELKEKFNIVSPEIILVDKNIKTSELRNMLDEIENVEGIDFALSFNKLESMGISRELLSEDIIKIFESDNYQMVLINSSFEIASDELNNQVDVINNIIDKYDDKAILAGEGPLMKDLVTISDTDFKNVNASSIVCILMIMLFVLRSVSLPILLILVIEFAIFINMSIPYFSGIELPFVAPIVLGTIQLGATIDYAILVSTTYLKHRKNNLLPEEAIKETLNTSVGSIIVSGMCFFGATFGVGIYSDLEMISSLCTLISRGAIISMVVVIFILPAILLIFDKLIIKTTSGFKRKDDKKMKNNIKKGAVIGAILLGVLYANPVYALTKDETVYAKLNSDGTVRNIIVNEHLSNLNNKEILEDESNLLDIININGKEEYKINGNKITWYTTGNDIYYQGKTNKELPVNLSVKYYLDDEEKTLDELLGKSGKIKLEIKYTNSNKHVVKVNGKSETLYTPFMVTTGLIIKGSESQNVVVSNGKVINNGKDNMVVGISTPGLYESLKLNDLKGMDKVVIEYTTSKFELPNIYSVITPKVISRDDLKIFDKMDDLYKNVDILKESIDEIEAGSKALLDGAYSLNENTKALASKIKLLNDGAKSLKNGSVELDNGISYLLKTITEAKKELSKLNSSEAANTLSSATMQALALTQGTPIGDLINENVNSLTVMKNTWTTITTTISKNKEMIKTLSSTEELKEQNKSIIALLEHYNKLLGATLPTTLNSMLAELETGVKSLKSGSTKIVNGTTTLYNGVDALAKNVPALSNGVNKLYLGSKSLNEGILKYNKDGITNISNLVNINVKSAQNRIEALVKLGENYQTFTMNNKANQGETKFVLTISGVKYEEKEEKQKEIVKDTSLWTKIKNLFK